MKKVNYWDLKWEDLDWGAIYNGRKFTGLAFIENEDRYSEYQYFEGQKHGRHFGINKENNKIFWEEFYEFDKPIKTHFGWRNFETQKHINNYENGQVVISKIEDKFGRLIFEFNRHKKEMKEWYPNGNNRSFKVLISEDNEYQFSYEQYWNEDGIWLMTLVDKKKYSFNENYLMQNTSQLESEEHERIVIAFSEYLISKNKKESLYFLHEMTEHFSPFFRYQAARLLGKIKDKSSIPYLENLLNQDIQPEREMTISWNDMGHSSKTACSISEMARKTIKEIN